MTTQVITAQRRVLADLIPGSRVRDVVLVLTGTAVVALTSQVTVPLWWTPVPLSLSTFGVLLTGMSLGPARGGASTLLYLGAGMAGVPWFAEQRSGWHLASFGYIIGYFFAAVIVGELARRGGDRTPARTIVLAALASLAIYACGVPWLMRYIHVDLATALDLGVRPFLVGDAIKAAAAAALMPASWALVNRFRDED
jgi:biotin transport system substrate-specific component